MAEEGQQYELTKSRRGGIRKIPVKEGLPVNASVDPERLKKELAALSTRKIKMRHRGRNRIGSGPSSPDRPHRHVSRRGSWTTS